MANTVSHKRRKIAAIGAGLLVAGLGVTYTLASWTDSEWVWGGADSDAGIGTSSFNVQQNRTSPYNEGADFEDQETNPGGGVVFSAGALALTPGDTIYAPVALRTATDSIAGEVTLQGAVAAEDITVNDDNEDLWKNITVSVHTAKGATPPSGCQPDFNQAGWTTIVNSAPLGTVASESQGLDAGAGSTQHYCFELTLNTELVTGSQVGDINELQGRTIAPAWEFKAVSN